MVQERIPLEKYETVGTAPEFRQYKLHFRYSGGGPLRGSGREMFALISWGGCASKRYPAPCSQHRLMLGGTPSTVTYCGCRNPPMEEVREGSRGIPLCPTLVSRRQMMHVAQKSALERTHRATWHGDIGLRRPRIRRKLVIRRLSRSYVNTSPLADTCRLIIFFCAANLRRREARKKYGK